mmetsp:Transcript_763/g.2988  ORF Transcript_763/g.2988 Transcript_763/m.2988 type:complete len:209 (-) Transcript_763:77-703(-)
MASSCFPLSTLKSPVYTTTLPPGRTKAFTSGESTTTNSHLSFFMCPVCPPQSARFSASLAILPPIFDTSLVSRCSAGNNFPAIRVCLFKSSYILDPSALSCLGEISTRCLRFVYGTVSRCVAYADPALHTTTAPPSTYRFPHLFGGPPEEEEELEEVRPELLFPKCVYPAESVYLVRKEELEVEDSLDLAAYRIHVLQANCPTSLTIL